MGRVGGCREIQEDTASQVFESCYIHLRGGIDSSLSNNGIQFKTPNWEAYVQKLTPHHPLSALILLETTFHLLCCRNRVYYFNPCVCGIWSPGGTAI